MVTKNVKSLFQEVTNETGLMERKKLVEESEAPRLSRFVGTGHVSANRNLVEITLFLGLSGSLSRRVRYPSISE
jgi:hypothetical protein